MRTFKNYKQFYFWPVENVKPIFIIFIQLKILSIFVMYCLYKNWKSLQFFDFKR